MLHTTISPDTTAAHAAHPAAHDARRALATAGKPACRQSPLDKAIEAADRFMQGEFGRASAAHSAAHSAAEEAVRRRDKSHRNARTAASAKVLAPSELCFPRDPANDLVSVEMHYADGHSRVTTYVREGFTPSDRASLIRYCAEKGLKPKRYLALWDQWAKDRSEAEDAVMPPEWQVAREAFDTAEAAWWAALDKQRELALAIINVRVTTAVEAVAQIDAYARTMQIDDPAEFADHEDALILASSLIKSLRVLAGQDR